MRRSARAPLGFAALVALSAALLVAPSPFAEGSDRPPTGRPAPPLGLESWVNSEPLEMEDLRGKVVLVRWWTDTCPFCSTSAPVLRELQEAYAGQGFTVVGVFHPKPAGDRNLARMRRGVERFGFTFPVALDAHWEALDRWWLSLGGRRFTSVSFVVDRRGVIRYVHPGGEFHPGTAGPHLPDHSACNRQYVEIRELIETLLAE